MKRFKSLFAVLMVLIMFISVIPITASAASDSGDTVHAEQSAELTFSDSGITETQAGTGYSISGTTLTITAAGTYRVNGSCTEGSIIVSKELTDVTLILDSLTLASSSTAPVVVKKAATVNIHLEGTSTLTDNEDPDNETSTDATIADAFEGAAIKIKSGASVTFCGDGNLNVVANAKNGIKGGATAALIFNQSGTINVSGSGKYYGGTTAGAAVNNGIACDGSIVFNQGTYVVKASNDGIKSAPDATDETEGTTIDTESAGTITVNGGTFDLDVDGDGFQADTALTINGGTFNIQTWKGYSVWNDTLADEYSCKGLKAGGDRAEEAGLEPAITITGGTFVLNTADDAVHSDAYATVTGGVFTIDTGDDGMHADTSLILGEEGGLERDPDVTINHSYEGLEGGTVYIYSGRYYVVASDDGVNAAGGSSSGSDPGSGGSDPFNPGGGGPGGHGGGWNPGGNSGGGSSSTASDYNIYIYGGDLYVNCDGDGLDSNGGLYLYGGTQAVFSMKSGGDNSAIDADGTVLIDGATIFTAGTRGMDGTAQSSWFGSSQKYASSTTSYTAGRIINAKAGSSGSVVFSYTLPKNVNYTMASWPSSVSSSAPSLATASSVTSCKGGSWSHNWNSGTVTTAATSTSTGVMTYTCTSCGETETRTIPMTVSVAECDHSVEIATTPDEGYTVTFAGDSGVSSIIVYETQDYTGTSETVSAAGTTVSRSSDTGAPDSSGSGQVNFTVVLADGFSLSGITVTEGTYKNIKSPTDTGLANTDRITKITADTTITITTVACAHGVIADGTTPVWTWGAGFGTAVLSYTCAECGGSINVDGTVTSVLTDASTITFTAAAEINGISYTDTQTASPYTATFSGDAGVASISVYYTQDYTTADEENTSAAVARDSDSGCPVITGDGQVNFTVIPADGYTVENVTITGSYKNLKGPADTGMENTYRITKVSSDLTITITTVEGEDEGYPVSFVTDEHAAINLYYTQDYTEPDETDVTSAVSRSSDSGKPDSSGDGQLNFAVVVDDGYELDAIVIDGSYKAIKDVSTEDIANLYRITKVASELTVTVTTKEASPAEVIFEPKEGSTTVFSEIDGVDYIYGLLPGLTAEDFLADYVNCENAVVEFSGEIATGTTVTVTAADSGAAAGDYVIIIFGDVDSNGWYDGQDAAVVNCLANGMLTREQVGEAAYMAADCNHDGSVTADDVAILEQAGVLLADVNQTLTQEELIETQAYQEYLGIIDQSPDAETADEPIDEPSAPASKTLLDRIMEIVRIVIAFIRGLFTKN